MGLGARLDPRSLYKLSSGVEPAWSPGTLATKHSIAATEVRLSNGHKGIKVKTTIACRAQSSSTVTKPRARYQVSDPFERAFRGALRCCQGAVTNARVSAYRS